MSNIDIHVPDLGTEGEVEVIEVLVEEGDVIALDDPVVVLESDKASMEVPASAAGIVASVVVSVGQKIKQDDLILSLRAGETTAPIVAEAAIEAKATNPKTESPAVQSKSSPTRLSQESIVVPDMGGVSEAEVIEVLVAEGDHIDPEQGVIVLETDKASMDIPSSISGKIVKLCVAIGDKLAAGDLVAIVEVAEAGSVVVGVEAKVPSHVAVTANASAVKLPVSTSAPSLDTALEGQGSVALHAGPAVRKLARELGVDLARVKATGPKRRIQKDDLNAYIKDQVQRAQSGVASLTGIAQPVLPDFSQFGEIEIRKLERIQRVTAENMQSSWSNVPHVTQFDEADITDLEAFRKGKRGEAEALGLKLSPLPFLIKACAHALNDLPQFNVSLDLANQQMIHKKYIHIGVAVDTGFGLVVPVIRDVMNKTIWQLTSELTELVGKAKARKLSPADMQGASFTITSLGGIGGTSFTPIVNQPEVAILGVSKSQYKPVYINGSFEPRLMLPLSLSYDHRAVNGADGARFTNILAKYLSDIREFLF